MSVSDKTKNDIESIVREINRSWTQYQLDKLEKYFHSDMIIQGPAFQDSIKGSRNCVKHYEDFAANTKIKNYKDSEYIVNVWDKTAVVSYKFDIEFESDGEIRKESGHELYTFLREDNAWKAVWNTIVPSIGN